MAPQEPAARHDHASDIIVGLVLLAGIIILMAQRQHHVADNSGALVQAAEYVRMSTDHQQYSTENQHDAIQRFADTQGMTIVPSSTRERVASAFKAAMRCRNYSGPSKAVRQTSARSSCTT